MTALKGMRKTLAVLAICVGVGAGVCLLPDDSYQRWQLLDGTIHARARWIYERSHFDPTPIDVALVGPSRMGAGVNAPRLGQELAARGLPSHVVNFSLPETGRNINYAIVEQMLEEKRPRLIVLGVIEKPARFGHSAFKYIAPRSLIVDPGYLGDANYLPDLVYLPFRQMRLFLADVAPGMTGLTKRFDPSRYRGPSVDTTGSIVLPGGRIKQGDAPASASELRRGVRKLEAGMHPPILPARFADIEFGDERHYIRQIAGIAQAHGVRVAFLFLPYYTGPTTIQEAPLYQRYGPIWNAGFLSPHAEWYADYGHLTRTGAEHLTDWLATPVAAVLEKKSPG